MIIIIPNFLRLTGRIVEALNVSSYNYLGFAQSSGPCTDEVIKAIHTYGISVGSAREEVGTGRILLI